MNVEAYLNPDFTWYKKAIFCIITFLMLAVAILIIAGIEKIFVKEMNKEDREIEYRDRLTGQNQRLFEMIISGTSVMLFSCSYVIINHIYTLVTTGAARANTRAIRILVEAWAEGKDFFLLLLIVMSCIVNSILDRFLIPLNRLSKDEKATMRMLGMFYVIIILIYLNYIGDESQYSPVMIYYFGLMIGRFVYFDASFMDFLSALKNVFFNLPFLLLNLTLTGLLCFIGFKWGFFIERNYYIVGVFYAHLFMILCIFVIYWVYRLSSMLRKKIKYHSIPT